MTTVCMAHMVHPTECHSHPTVTRSPIVSGGLPPRSNAIDYLRSCQGLDYQYDCS